jgi:hypothetical protein
MNLSWKREQALRYARESWAVLPLNENAKTPLTRHGHKDATKDIDTVTSWWTSFPEANIGIRTGLESGILVVDIDRKNGVDGMQEAERLRLGEFPTLTVKTPNGTHLYYRHPGDREYRCAIGVCPGIDLKCDGGYVVAAGSVVGGVEYEITNIIG